jgi:hypothetical protein
MDQQPPDIAVAAFADSKERGLSAGRVFPWYQAEPCCEIASPPELTAVAYGSKQRGGGKWADAGNRHQPARPIIPGGEPLDLPGRAGDPLIESDDVLDRARSAFDASP